MTITNIQSNKVQAPAAVAQAAATAAVAVRAEFMAGAVERRNADGKLLGRTLSFIGVAPAGDIKKALAATGLKGKALKAKVGEVLRGEKEQAWALFEGQASVMRSHGYVPVKIAGNKDASVMTGRFEKAPLPAKEAAMAILGVTKEDMARTEVVKSLSAEDMTLLMALITEQKAKAPATINV